MKKIKVGVLFGGRSAEHEVSLQSAKNVINALDKNKYEVILIGVTKEGKWLLQDSKNYLLNASDPKLIALNKTSSYLAITPSQDEGQLVTVSNSQSLGSLDVIFPVVHGPNIEDGTIQGLLKLLNIPFVGPSVLGAAITMDKDTTKRLLRDANIPVAKFRVFHNFEKDEIEFNKIVKELGLPFFVKPPTLGSSVGVSKVKKENEFQKAIELAFLYDTKVLIEEYIEGREIECAVLGNENPKASVIGEVILHHEFYSYEAKYIDEHGADIEIPAKISDEITKEVQELAIKTFQVLSCEGMSRIDFFLDKDNKAFVNEVNPIPGFTSISMYPKLWEASGISYSELIDQLIALAIERFNRDKKLKTSFT